MRKVFLDDLPRWNSGGNKGKINWKETIGYKVPFIYNDIIGEIEIVNYEKERQNLTVRYKGEEFGIKCYEFRKASVGRVVGGRTIEFKVEVGHVFKDEKRDLLILDREYRNIAHKQDENGKVSKQKVKYYKYLCRKCGWSEGWSTETLLINRKDSCSCCRGLTPVLGINTIWDTNKDWVKKFGISEVDAKKHTKGSGEFIDIICPDCGTTKKIQIDSVRSNKSIGCFCGDSYSYSEKVMTNLLKQLNVEFETQVQKNTLSWCGKYRYDFYLPHHNMIIETHGGQHYSKRDFRRLSGKTFKQEQENDRLKKELAIENGVKKEDYIVIDCRYSELDWVKNNILDSRLTSLFDFSMINWIECEKFAFKNTIKEVCDYWNNKEDWKTTTDLAKIFGVNSSTISRYLKKGTRLGWTDYKSKDEVYKVAKTNGEKSAKRNSIPILAFKEDVFIGRFGSAAELARNSEEILGVKLSGSCIRDVIVGKREKHKGYIFKCANQH